MTAPRETVASHFADAEQQHDAAVLGMWLFLLTEVMLFGGLFLMYAVYRYLHPQAFAAASHHLDLWLGTVNTAVLIASSLTMALAQQAAQHAPSQRRRQLLFLILTLLLGGTFLAVKSIEYRGKFTEQLVPGPSFQWDDPQPTDPITASQNNVSHASPPDVGSIELFYSLYFVMTGLHAAHMLIGPAVLLVLIGLTFAGRARAVSVELTGLYWHFVDIVWIFLFPLLYLIGRHQ